MARVLVVEDEENMRRVLAANLRQDAHHLVMASCVRDGMLAINGQEFDVVLLDQRLPDGDGAEILHNLVRSGSHTSAVMLTAFGTVELAVEAMRHGAFDYLTKPFSAENLRAVVQRASEQSALRRENDLLREAVDRLAGESEIRGNSAGIVRLREMICKVGPTDATILITGETGTGKELVARALHQQSRRAARPMISVNCAAFSETLLESELFGHEKGAFTGADRLRHGLFETAHQGTLFLDEAGEMSASAQAKLLRVLAEGKIARVGSTIARDVDVRVLVATHRNLRQEVAEGRFRDDLYYRLAIVPMEVPPLRERKEDLRVIADYLLTQICRDLKLPLRRLHADALHQLGTYDFPGNVRELRNLLERACILSSGEVLRWIDLPEDLNKTKSSEQGYPALRHLELPLEIPLRAMLAGWEREIIKVTLERTNGSKAEAARRLGLSKSDISYRLAKHRL